MPRFVLCTTPASREKKPSARRLSRLQTLGFRVGPMGLARWKRGAPLTPVRGRSRYLQTWRPQLSWWSPRKAGTGERKGEREGATEPGEGGGRRQRSRAAIARRELRPERPRRAPPPPPRPRPFRFPHRLPGRGRTRGALGEPPAGLEPGAGPAATLPSSFLSRSGLGGGGGGG